MIKQQQSDGNQRMHDELRRLTSSNDQMVRGKARLADDGSRLTGLVDHMHDEARDAVTTLPRVEPPSSSAPTGASFAHVPTVGEVVEEAIHRLVTMGVFTPNNRDAPRGADRSDYVPEDFMSAGSADTGAGAPPEASSSVPRASPTTRTNDRDPEPGFVFVGKDKDKDDDLHKKRDDLERSMFQNFPL